MSKVLQKVAYGICENIKFPCFFRLIFSVGNENKIQVFENKEIALISVNVDSIKNDILEISNNIYLDISKPNYGIALSEKEIYCGTKEELEKELKLKIKTLNPYFQVEYYNFMQDFLNLRIAYYQLSKYEKASSRTKEWAIAEYTKIDAVIALIIQELRKNSISVQYVRSTYTKPRLFFKTKEQKKNVASYAIKKIAQKHCYQKRAYDDFLKTLEDFEKTLNRGKIKSIHSKQVKLPSKPMIGTGKKSTILSNIPVEQQACAKNIMDKFVPCTD